MRLGMIGLGRTGASMGALFGRFTSRGEAGFQNRLFSAMRFEFGGHVEKGPGP